MRYINTEEIADSIADKLITLGEIPERRWAIVSGDQFIEVNSRLRTNIIRVYPSENILVVSALRQDDVEPDTKHARCNNEDEAVEKFLEFNGLEATKKYLV